MDNQTMSVRRFVITNLLILAVIGFVCLLSLNGNVLHSLTLATNAPVFMGNAGKGAVALEIAFCGDADFDACEAVLQKEKVKPSVFFCPESMKNHPGYLKKAEKIGLDTGLYYCGIHPLYQSVDADMMVLGDFSEDAGVFSGLNSVRRVCWTVDANKILERSDGESYLADHIYEDNIIMYRYTDSADQLSKLIKIIREKGYNITDDKSIMG